MAEPMRVGFFVSGQGQLFRDAADVSDRLGISPTLVVAETKAAPDLEEFCGGRGIPFERLDPHDRSTFDRRVATLAIEARLDLLCLTFDRIVSAGLVAHYRGRIVNVHPALLPSFPGPNALVRAAGSGARFAGATIHEVTEEVDAGPIVAQCVVGLCREDTAEAVGRRIYVLLRPMFLQVLAWYATSRVTHDDQGRAWIRDAVYGELPTSPTVEEAFKPAAT
jgi:phosphoribosylglycinamide formyltransferase-1